MNSMYGMIIPEDLFVDKFTYWLINEPVFKQSHFQMSIYYKYAPDGTNIVFEYYVDCFVYWYTYEALGNGL